MLLPRSARVAQVKVSPVRTEVRREQVATMTVNLPSANLRLPASLESDFALTL